MLSLTAEKKLLQIVLSVACLVPILAGGGGMLLGAAFLEAGSINMDSHFRYLSGLLFAIGLGFLSMIPHIERHNKPMQLLTFLVVTGGIARLGGMLAIGSPHTSMILALIMEVVITPALCFWQWALSVRTGHAKNGGSHKIY